MHIAVVLIIAAACSAAEINPGVRVSISERGVEAIRSVANGFVYDNFMSVTALPDSDYGFLKASDIKLKPYHPPIVDSITVKDGEHGNGSLVLKVRGGLMTGTAKFTVADFKFMGFDFKSDSASKIGIREFNGEVHMRGFTHEGRPVFRIVHCDVVPEFKIKSISGGKVAKVADRFKGPVSSMVSKYLGRGMCNQLTTGINTFNDAAFKYPTMTRLMPKKDSMILNYGMMPNGFQIWSAEGHRPVEMNMYGSFMTAAGKVVVNHNHKLETKWTPKDDKMFYIEMADDVLKPFVENALTQAYQIKSVLWGDSILALMPPADVKSLEEDGGYLKIAAMGQMKYETDTDVIGAESAVLKVKANVNAVPELELEVVDVNVPVGGIGKEEKDQIKMDVNDYLKKNAMRLPIKGVELDRPAVVFFDNVIRMETDVYKH